MASKAKAPPSRQPRRPKGSRDGGQWSAKPVADSPGAEGFTLGGDSPTVRHPPVTCSIKGKRVKFTQTADGSWEHNLEGCDMLWMLSGTEPDYWASGEWAKDAAGVSVWAASTVRDMLNAGECDPRDPKSAQTALRATYAAKGYDNGRFALAAAMARTRAWNFLRRQSPGLQIGLGGFSAGGGERNGFRVDCEMSVANAMDAYSVLDTHNRRSDMFARPGAGPGGGGPYLGEDGDLLRKVLFADTGRERLGVDVLWHRASDNVLYDPLSMYGDPFTAYNTKNSGWIGMQQPASDGYCRRAAIRAAVNDPRVKDRFIASGEKEAPSLEWIKELRRHVARLPREVARHAAPGLPSAVGADGVCAWGGDVEGAGREPWTQAIDLLTAAVRQRREQYVTDLATALKCSQSEWIELDCAIAEDDENRRQEWERVKPETYPPLV